MINVILSLILGAGLDSLYYFLYIVKIKNIKTKKFMLYLGIFLGYVLLFMILRYNLYLYLVFYLYIYLMLKIFYKSKVIDFFLLIFIDFYVLLVSIACFYLIKNYAIALIINKIVIFIPLIFKDKLKQFYDLNYKMWNRDDKKKTPIKSLTLRNIFLMVFNIFIVINYIILLILVKK